MNTKKQQAIANAYGEYWEQVKDYVNENGWGDSDKAQFLYNNGLNKDFEQSAPYRNGMGSPKFFIRPKSLQGIENNNGWIAIESEDGLPKEESYMFVIDKEKTLDEYLIHIKCFHNTKYDINNYLKKYSHYQPIILPSKPHY